MKYIVMTIFAFSLLGLTGCGSSGGGNKNVNSNVDTINETPKVRSIPLPMVVPNYFELVDQGFFSIYGIYRANYLDKDGNHKTIYMSDGQYFAESGFDASMFSLDQPNQNWAHLEADPNHRLKYLETEVPRENLIIRKYDERDMSLGSNLSTNPTNLEIFIGSPTHNRYVEDENGNYGVVLDPSNKSEMEITKFILDHDDSFFVTAGNTVRNLPIGTHNYGGIGNSVNLVLIANYVINATSSRLVGELESGTIDLVANFDDLTVSINGETPKTKITSDLNIDPKNGSFGGNGIINIIGVSNRSDNYSETMHISGTFHGNMAEGVSGIYRGFRESGAFVANKR